LASAYPAERQSILALLAAGRLYPKRLDHPEDAFRNYKAAAASPVPHIDRAANIQTGVKDGQQALARISARTTITKS
jgi:hypothetical protein